MRKETPKAIHLKDYLPTPYLINEVRLTFKLHPTETRVKAEIHFRTNPKAKSKAQPLELDGEKITLLSVQIDGKSLAKTEYRLTSKKLVIVSVPKRPFVLTIETECNPQANTELSGLYISNGIYCTQCEAEGFRRITYFYDRPDVMARYQVRIEAPLSHRVLLSNGNPSVHGAINQSGQHFSEWTDPHPKPAYLFALVAGDLACVEDQFTTIENRNVRLGIYVEKGKENRCAWAMQSLKAAMRWDEKVFKRAYDLDVFNIVAVSDFNMGAMENKGLNIFNDKYILALPETATDMDYELIETIIAHEYFHNWTGNRITCRDWFQLCLKEGLTVFRDQEFTSDLRSRAVKRIDDVQDLRDSQFPEDFGPLQHPPRQSNYIEINNFYTSTVYEKGAEICRMIKTLIGGRDFDKAMQLYFKRHDGQAATVEQFIRCFEDASGRKLKQFFRWYEQAGTPNVSVTENYNQQRKVYSLTLSQKTLRLRGQKPKLPFHIPLEIGFIPADGKSPKGKSQLIELTKATQVFKFKSVASKPVLSINRGFSAPIVIKHKISTKDQLLLMTHDTDSFNRWEAAQTIALDLILDRYRTIGSAGWDDRVTTYATAVVHVLENSHLEDAYKAKLLEFPDYEVLMASLGKNIDATKLEAARNMFLQSLARNQSDAIQTMYNETEDRGPYQPSGKDNGRRALRYALLELACSGKLMWAELAVENESKNAHNMTAAFASLELAAKFNSVAGQDIVDSFHQRYGQDSLLVNKWFAAQALVPGKNAPLRVKKLSKHPDFKWTTPNRVYALLRNFVDGNFSGFHTINGAGYELAADAIIKLDDINPQVASRLATGFSSWRMFDMPRRATAQKAMQRILKKKPLSADVYEIISRTLAV